MAQSWPSYGPTEAIPHWKQSALFCSQKTPQVGDLLLSTNLLGFDHSSCAFLSIKLTLVQIRLYLNHGMHLNYSYLQH